jgi:cell division inhibitor SepF
MSLWKKTMDYLGLGPDDAYDEYDDFDDYDDRSHRANDSRGPRPLPEDPDAPRPAPRPSFPSRDFDASRRSQPNDEPTVNVRGGQRQAAAPGNGRQGGASSAVSVSTGEPYTVHPRRFDQAQELADKFKDGLPVIMNLEGTDREVSRRLIDFASGICYALDGSMEKVATGVYLLKPPLIRTRPHEYD